MSAVSEAIKNVMSGQRTMSDKLYSRTVCLNSMQIWLNSLLFADCLQVECLHGTHLFRSSTSEALNLEFRCSQHLVKVCPITCPFVGSFSLLSLIRLRPLLSCSPVVPWLCLPGAPQDTVLYSKSKSLKIYFQKRTLTSNLHILHSQSTCRAGFTLSHQSLQLHCTCSDMSVHSDLNPFEIQLNAQTPDFKSSLSCRSRVSQRVTELLQRHWKKSFEVENQRIKHETTHPL